MTDAIKPGAVIFAKDVAKLARFYEQVVPMRAEGDDHGAIILETDALQLVIHPIPRAIAAGITITVPPQPRSNSAVKLVFAVDDLERVRAAAVQQGGGVKPDKASFVARGFRACDGHDPEGNPIQFRVPAG